MSKILRIFGHAKFPVKRYRLRCRSRRLSRLLDGRFFCRCCRFKFSFLTNTYLERSFLALDQRYELLWRCAYGFTANRTAKEVKLSQQRVHNCFCVIRRAIYDYEQSQMSQFHGEVEVDETYIGPKFKNRRKNKRDLYRRINAVKRGRGAKILQQPVFGLYRRDGQVYIEFTDEFVVKLVEILVKFGPREA